MNPTPKALLVYPRFPPSYWGFRYAVEMLGKRSAMPPLGLLTVAALFPEHWRLRVVDLNVAELTDADLAWADLVLTSTMVVQQGSLREVIARANRAGKPIAVGGPHPTSFSDDIANADHYLLDEVEESFPRFLADWEAGRAERVYRPGRKPDVTVTPPPRYDLLDLGAYASMALQFSRGCPFNCEFCDITKLFGRVPRTKSNEQMVAELQGLYDLGWRGPVFLVDDNFIGNKKEALRLLPAVAQWQRERGFPFDFYTEASVNLAKLEPLMDAMVDAGFTMVFLGIESPNPEALRQTQKTQNTSRGDDDFLLHAVTAIQAKGLEVSGGFILGLDGDGPEVFDAQVAFIQEAGIPMAMVGLLTALRGTDLYDRLEREGRLLAESSGNNVEVTLNFRSELDRDVLISGYRRVLDTLYDPGLDNYFERCWTLLRRLGERRRPRSGVRAAELRALFRSLRVQLFSRQGPAYLKLLARVLLHRPRLIDQAVRQAIKGYHFRKFTAQTLAAHEFRTAALDGYGRVEALAEEAGEGAEGLLPALRRQAGRARRRLRRIHRRLRPEFRQSLLPDRASFDAALQACLREAGELALLRRWAPRFRHWSAGASWTEALDREGYAPGAGRLEAGGRPTVSLAPLLEHGRTRRALEQFFHELGVKVISTTEQLQQLGADRLEKLQGAGEAVDRLRGYLRQVGRNVDALIVPFGAGSAEDPTSAAPTGHVRVLAAPADPTDPAGPAGSLPRLILFRLEESHRRLREALIELGVALTGDAGRAELAYERAFALV